MNAEDSIDYRKILRQFAEERKALSPSLNYRSIALAMRMEPSFLSKVMRGNTHFSRDQLFSACECLKLGAEDCSFLQLLHEYQTSGLQRRKDILWREIKHHIKIRNDTSSHIDAQVVHSKERDISTYYLDPMNQIVHVALSIEKCRKDPDKLASVLGIPRDQMHQALAKLGEMGLIKVEDGEIRVLSSDMQLSRDAAEYYPWRLQLMMLGQIRAQRLPKEQAYGYSVVFSSDEKAREKILAKFFEFLKDAQKIAVDAPADNVYQMNFDVINWV
ncbi:MAG: DUF4423 domain-containing protein [Oligoflexales bacterium]